jgi:hypothetical protein
MSKRQEKPGLRERLKELPPALARTLTLTVGERAVVAGILLSLLAGALTAHYRREYRLHHPETVRTSGAPATPRPFSRD